MAYINKEELRQLINQLKNDTDDVAILVGINRVGSGIDKLPTADVISAEAYNQVAWERDMAMQQIESYGVSFGSNAELAKVKHGHFVRNVRNIPKMKEFPEKGFALSMNTKSIFWTCSCCGSWASLTQKYCSECGAKMDGERRDA
jgi:hypothetical protein